MTHIKPHPKVEIHGMDGAAARKLRNKILDYNNWDEFEVTIVEDTTINRKGEAEPFLRLYCDQHIDNYESVLGTFGLKMEIMPYYRVVPAKTGP